VTVPYAQGVGWIEEFGSTMAVNREYLTQLDSAIGDADHGINMDRGMKAVLAKLEGLEGDDVGGLLKTVGMTLVSSVGGAGGSRSCSAAPAPATALSRPRTRSNRSRRSSTRPSCWATSSSSGGSTSSSR